MSIMKTVVKFRVWDIQRKKWVESIRINQKRSTLQGNAPFATVSFGSDDKYIISRFTGLHDRNGVEIYEGDILRYSFGEEPHYVQNTGLVIWDECHFMIDGLAGWWTTEVSTHSYETLHNSAKELVFEVIGSKYTNPELLQ